MIIVILIILLLLFLLLLLSLPSTTIIPAGITSSLRWANGSCAKEGVHPVGDRKMALNWGATPIWGPASALEEISALGSESLLGSVRDRRIAL